MDDNASRHWGQTDTALHSYFNSCSIRCHSWLLCHPTPTVVCMITNVLHGGQKVRVSDPPIPDPDPPPGGSGSSSAGGSPFALGLSVVVYLITYLQIFVDRVQVEILSASGISIHKRTIGGYLCYVADVFSIMGNDNPWLNKLV